MTGKGRPFSSFTDDGSVQTTESQDERENYRGRSGYACHAKGSSRLLKGIPACPVCLDKQQEGGGLLLARGDSFKLKSFRRGAVKGEGIAFGGNDYGPPETRKCEGKGYGSKSESSNTITCREILMLRRCLHEGGEGGAPFMVGKIE